MLHIFKLFHFLKPKHLMNVPLTIPKTILFILLLGLSLLNNSSKSFLGMLSNFHSPFCTLYPYTVQFLLVFRYHTLFSALTINPTNHFTVQSPPILSNSDIITSKPGDFLHLIFLVCSVPHLLMFLLLHSSALMLSPHSLP